jgi:hypothetical protein
MEPTHKEQQEGKSMKFDSYSHNEFLSDPFSLFPFNLITYYGIWRINENISWSQVKIKWAKWWPKSLLTELVWFLTFVFEKLV